MLHRFIEYPEVRLLCKGWKVVGMESLREKSGMRMDDKEKEKSILGKKNRKKERVE